MMVLRRFIDPERIVALAIVEEEQERDMGYYERRMEAKVNTTGWEWGWIRLYSANCSLNRGIFHELWTKRCEDWGRIVEAEVNWTGVDS